MVNNTNWTVFLARIHAFISKVLILLFCFGPVKLPGLSRYGPRTTGQEAWVQTLAWVIVFSSWARHLTLAGKFSNRGKPCDRLASHQEEEEIFLVASRYRNQNKFWPYGPLLAFLSGAPNEDVVQNHLTKHC